MTFVIKESFDLKKSIINFVLIAVGVSCLSLAANVFYAPNNIVVGGFSGLAILIQSLTVNFVEGGIPLSITNFVLNIPLFIAAYFCFGKKYVTKTFFTTILFSVALQLGEGFSPYRGDYTLIAVFGGVLDGVGIGLVLRAMASTGGVDTLAMLIHKKAKHISVSKIIFALDAIIIGAGVFTFGIEKAMYAVIAVFITSKVITVVLEGFSFSKAAFIISEKSEEIANEIMDTHGRGVTALRGKGMYTENEKDVLLCVFGQKEITIIKDIVRKHDPNAFLIVADINEVMGEGFKSLDDMT